MELLFVIGIRPSLPQNRPMRLIGFEVVVMFLKVFLHSFVLEYRRLSCIRTIKN